MASRFTPESKVQLKPRKGHDMKWSCDKHAEPIAFQCKKHKISICHRCATKDHGQKPCELEDIEDVVLEMRRKLEDTQPKIEPAKKRLKTLRSKLESSETSASNHLQSVRNNLQATYKGKFNSVKDKERDEIRLINEEADEEIRIINDKRIKRIKACMEEAKKQRQSFIDSAAKLIIDIQTINEKVKKKIDELRNKNQHSIATVDNMVSKIERIKQDDETLVNETPQVIASLDESLCSNFHQEVADYLARIEREVQRVKFVEGEVGGKHYGRIDGYIGKLELVKSIDITSIVSGVISDDEIVLDSKNNALFVTHISTEQTEKVIEEDMYITSCAPVDSKAIVCGKEGGNCTGDCLLKCITIYDRQWKMIRDITIPRNTPSLSNTVCVDVDMNGMILAVQEDQSNIYIINPADGKIVNTITMKGKEAWGRIQVLSSSDIVMKTYDKEFTVISRSGEEKAVIHCGGWKWPRCYVDKLTDTLYITYRDREGRNAVDQVSCDGNIQAKRIVEYKQSHRCPYYSPCLVTPSGNLVTCNGEKLLVYKKSFIV